MEHLVLGATAFLVTVLAIGWLCERFRLNPPLVLLLAGLLGSYLPFVIQPQLTPDMVLVGALPPLLYASSVNTSLVNFRRNISTIGLLSVGLVLFTAFGVAVVVHQCLGIRWAPSVALGAVVAPPDAVAATAVARSIGLPRRVVTVLEGESLVNDATALVTMNTAIAAMTAVVTVLGVARDFLLAVAVAVLVGAVVAKVALVCFRFTDDVNITTALSLVIPFVAYVPAEQFDGSGVLAVVVAGLILGNQAPTVLSGTARLSLRINWRTVQYVLENAVFLLIGLQVRSIIDATRGAGLPAARVLLVCVATLLAVVLLRVVWILATRLALRIGPRQVSTPARESAVIAWAGMRGVVTLAAALGLPTATPYRSVLILVALSVTLGTLLVQGLTLPMIARRLDVRGPDPREDALQEATVYQHAVDAGLRAAALEAGPNDQDVLDRMADLGERRVNSIWERLGRPEDEVETPSEAWRRLRNVAIQAERETVLGYRRDGSAEHEVLEGVLGALDMEEVGMVRHTEEARRARSSRLQTDLPSAPCRHLADSPCSVRPQTPGYCPECRDQGTDPVHLRMCLSCGHVGCCDSSVGQHAARHFQETGHPTMRSIEPGEDWRWCYVDEVLGGSSDD